MMMWMREGFGEGWKEGGNRARRRARDRELIKDGNEANEAWRMRGVGNEPWKSKARKGRQDGEWMQGRMPIRWNEWKRGLIANM